MTTRTINYRPRKLVKSFHKRQERFAVIVAHRRFGKTVAAINDLIKTALTTERKAHGFLTSKQSILVHVEYRAAMILSCPAHP